MKRQTICCVAGKSGGHIIPCLTIVHNSRTNTAHQHILFFSSNTPLDITILANNPAVTWHIPLPLSTRAGSYIKTLFYAFNSFIISFWHLWQQRPEHIITTGGIVAIPPCIAGFLLRIPITLYSLDAVPGKAIKMLTPLAHSIVTCFASAQHYFPAQKCSLEPYPIKYKTTDNYIDQKHAQKSLGLSSEKKTILVLGGSQGSLFLNECIKLWITDPLFNTKNLQIIHQTGSADSTDWKTLYNSYNITAHVFGYYPDLALMYAAADLIICRAGAGTLFEVKFFNKQCIIIPLSTNTTDHQIDNARAMSADYPDLFEYILQDDIKSNPAILFDRLNTILSKQTDPIDEAYCEGMQATPKKWSSKNDAETFSDL